MEPSTREWLLQIALWIFSVGFLLAILRRAFRSHEIKMTKVHWAKALQAFFLLLPTTVLLGPFLLGGSIGGFFAILAILFGTSYTPYAKAVVLRSALVLLLLELGGILGLVSLWILTVKDPRMVASRLCRFTVLGLLAGMAAASYWLAYLFFSYGPSRLGPTGVFLWLYVLVAPLILSLWYLYRLFSDRCSSRPADLKESSNP